jgi:hypothetical protein
MGPLFYGEFADFTISYLQFLYLYSTDNMYYDYKVKVPMYNI